jgi:renalase
MSSSANARVAVIGAGMAGATCARYLADAGFDVQVFDKSRGVGGRMANRPVEWISSNSVEHPFEFDHGSPAFTAHSQSFACFVEQGRCEGLLARWAPVMAAGSHPPLDTPTLWVPVPDMPALCRSLLKGLPVRADCKVDALRHDGTGWRVHSTDFFAAKGFDTVVVAIPPQQAAPLLRPHQPRWAQCALAMPMLPVWTLMGVTDDHASARDWNLAWPTSSPLAWIVRNDAKPGRRRIPGLAQWVVHASAQWSQTHFELAAAEVQTALQAAVAPWLGRSPTWFHAAVHRWRYASAPRAPAASSRCWWDAHARLGVCGDALGGAGVEGAWLSGRALATAIIEHRDTLSAAPSPSLSAAR